MRFWTKKPNPLDELIDECESAMLECQPGSKEYKVLRKELKQLRTLRAESKPKPINRDTILLGILNLLGIGLIVAYEQKHVMVSKAFGERPKPKYPS